MHHLAGRNSDACWCTVSIKVFASTHVAYLSIGYRICSKDSAEAPFIAEQHLLGTNLSV